MRVAFIPTAYRTIFFHALAERLEESGHEIFWLSPNGRWARWLVRHGVAEERVLDVTRWGPDWTRDSRLTADDLGELAELERAGTLRLRNILLMDSLLARKGEQHALKYFAVCARGLREFLTGHGVRMVLGEQTWAFELLVGLVCEQLGVPQFVPHTVRIPDPRFGFFEGRLEAQLVGFREASDRDRQQAREFLEHFGERYSHPGYMKINRAVLQLDGQRLRTLARHVLDLVPDRFDETSRRPLGLIVDHTRQLLRGRVNALLGPFSRPTLPPERPFVLFPLHMQPESSIDVKGDRYSNQIEIVRAMARTLPVTHELYVKEHAIALTRRTRRFYDELRSLPGIRLVHPRADSLELISAAELVVTITGTAAYEAALLGRSAATIAPIFFEEVVAYPRFDPFQDSLASLLDERTSATVESRVEFLARVYASSFPGTVGDALWQPHSLADENLSQVADGFRALLSKYEG